MAQETSSLTLYSGVPIDNTYKVHFGAYLTSALNSYDNVSFTRLSWIRVTANKIRLRTQTSSQGQVYNHYPDWFYDYNYLRFMNKNKSYFAFITGYEYVNDNTLDIFFEIDVLGTYWADFSFQECFIQREHVAKNLDTVGAYTMPEPVALGEYTCIEEETIDALSQKKFSVMFFMCPSITKETLINSYDAGVRNGVICGCEMFAVNAVDPTDITITPPEHIMAQLVGGSVNVDTILRAYFNDEFTCINAFFVPDVLIGTAPYAPSADTSFTRSIASDGSVSVNGVAIKNGKTFTSPYMYIEVDNRQGTTTRYKWELFPQANTANFWCYGTCIPSPTILCVPATYAGVEKDFNNANAIAEFPQCPVSSSDIGNWINQHLNGVAIRSTGGAILGALAGSAFGPVGALVGGITGVASPMISGAASLADAGSSPAKLTNSGGSPNALINLLSGNFGYKFKNMALKTDILQSVDNFFTRYGYRVDRIGTPHIYTRDRYNYIQNYETNITSKGIPTTAAKKICEIFNAGITIWHTTSDFGKYL